MALGVTEGLDPGAGFEALLRGPGKSGSMEVDAEMRRKIVVSLGAVALFITVLVGIGASFADGGLTPTGGYAIVGAVALFITLMAVVGVYLARS